MKEKFKKQKGITLVALVITIIVLLILAMVSISIVMNQGIMTKSKDASEKHQIAAEKEAIELAYSKYLTEKYNGETATLTVADANVQEDANEWTITFNAEPKNVYKLSKNGGEPDGPLTGDNAGGNEGTLTDEEMQAALQSFTANPQSYAHSEQSSTNKDRAIGTDGQAVNLDLWEYTVFYEDNKEIMLAANVCGTEGSGYSNDNIVDGKIRGTVPQYVYLEEKNKVYIVTSMKSTFNSCTELTQAPVIPSSVTDMGSTFYGCTSLTQAPVIPSSVANMWGTFYGCTSLTQAPEIPYSVTSMVYTFNGCIALTGTVKINSSNINNASGCFENVTNNITVQVPVNSTTYNTFNSRYGTASNITIMEEQGWWLPTDEEYNKLYYGHLIAYNEIGSSIGGAEVSFDPGSISISVYTDAGAVRYKWLYNDIDGKEPKKWYIYNYTEEMEAVYQEYNGPCPISKDLFTIICSESYLDRIIASFE